MKRIFFLLTVFSLIAACKNDSVAISAPPTEVTTTPKPLYVLSADERRTARLMVRDELTNISKSRIGILMPVVMGKFHSAPEIHQAYQDNEFAADAEFKDKRTLMTGEVETVSSTLGQAFIRLKSGALSWVQAKMRDPSDELLLKIKRGQHVNLVCIGTGVSILSPTFNDCQFYSSIENAVVADALNFLDEVLASGDRMNVDDKKFDLFLGIGVGIIALSPAINEVCPTDADVEQCLKANSKLFKNEKLFIETATKLESLGLAFRARRASKTP